MKRYAIHDGPGIRTTVFLKGCPLDCAWCQNPESKASGAQLILTPTRCVRCGACREVCPEPHGPLPLDAAPEDRIRCRVCGACVSACPTDARSLVGTEMSPGAVLVEIEKDRMFYEESGGGVTFSGGEPLQQAEFLLACLGACREAELHTAVDTCGHAPPEVMEAVALSCDLLLFDVKLADPLRHRRFTGVVNDLILDNLRRVCGLGVAVRVRYPLVPGLNDDRDALAGLASLLESLPKIPPVQILPYHRIGSDKYSRLGLPYRLAETRSANEEDLSRAAELLASRGLAVLTGG